MERPWDGPLSPWVSDSEKSDAVNRIARDLAGWREKEDAKPVPQLGDGDIKTHSGGTT